jgi:hypothetical protein
MCGLRTGGSERIATSGHGGGSNGLAVGSGSGTVAPTISRISSVKFRA